MYTSATPVVGLATPRRTCEEPPYGAIRGRVDPRGATGELLGETRISVASHTGVAKNQRRGERSAFLSSSPADKSSARAIFSIFLRLVIGLCHVRIMRFGVGKEITSRGGHGGCGAHGGHGPGGKRVVR